jgi:hypothetical protein
MGLSVWHLLIIALLLLVNLPALWVLKKAGWSRWHFLLVMLPLVSVIWLWVFAFTNWTKRPSAA